ncbi:hypothetical protein QCN27_18575, partial [Cereibacter sp. SYSU M97828]|nr:hypothetical protein [Cereibacter flavus]
DPLHITSRWVSSRWKNRVTSRWKSTPLGVIGVTPKFRDFIFDVNHLGEPLPELGQFLLGSRSVGFRVGRRPSGSDPENEKYDRQYQPYDEGDCNRFHENIPQYLWQDAARAVPLQSARDQTTMGTDLLLHIDQEAAHESC